MTFDIECTVPRLVERSQKQIRVFTIAPYLNLLSLKIIMFINYQDSVTINRRCTSVNAPINKYEHAFIKLYVTSVLYYIKPPIENKICCVTLSICFKFGTGFMQITNHKIEYCVN